MSPQYHRRQSNDRHRLDRRGFLGSVLQAGGGAAALLPATAVWRESLGAEAEPWVLAMPGSTFGFAEVDELAAALASRPYEAAPQPLPEPLRQLSPAGYHAIRFRPDATLWREEALPFQVQFFPRGSSFRQAVRLNVIDGEGVSSIPYNPQFFDFAGANLAEPAPEDLGFAGFRFLYALNRQDSFDEVGSFLGASYFRLVAAGQHYGLSARGLAIDTGLAKKEEFPAFREYWLKKPRRGAGSLEIYALLDSESLTGAYHFKVTPGSETQVEVSAKIYTRAAVEKLGLAPLTSMFFHGENTTRPVNDLRPEVHDSDGMLLASGSGEWIWRPITNRDDLQISTFSDESPRGFGLMQRDRDSRHYLDLDFNYDRRPSAWVEPQGTWGEGAAQLLEIPSDSERYDNIGLFWVPARPVESGQVWPFAYRLRFGGAFPELSTTGQTLATREARADETELRRFGIEFGGGPLSDLSETQGVQFVVSASAGKVVATDSRRNSATGTWLAKFDLDPEGEDVIELRAFLKDRDHALTETWSYLWKRN